MKLSEIQGKIKTLLASASGVEGSKLASVGITVEGDTDVNGLMVDLDETIADGVLARGFHIGILHPSTGESNTSSNSAGSGIATMWTTIPVVLAENSSINRDVAGGGLNRNPLQVAEEIITTLLHKPTGPFTNPFRLAPEPFFKTQNEAGFQYFLLFQARTIFK